MSRNEHILSWESGHLTLESLQAYNENSLSKLDMHKVERHVLNCDLCSDALEGFASESTKKRIKKDIQDLKYLVQERVGENKKVNPTWKRIGIAASFTLAIGLTIFFAQRSFKIIDEDSSARLAQDLPPEEKSESESFIANGQESDAEIAGQAEQERETPATLSTQSRSTPKEETSGGGTTEPEPSLSSGPADEEMSFETEVASTEEFDNTLADQVPPPPEEEKRDELESTDLDSEPLAVLEISEEEVAESPSKEKKSGMTQSRAQVSMDEAAGESAPVSAKTVTIPDSDPVPQGGLEKYKVYLGGNLIYPDEAQNNNISGTVKVEITLSPESEFSNLEIIQGLGFGCDEEAIRLIKKGPQWKPAIRNGQAVIGKVIVEVEFKGGS